MDNVLSVDIDWIDPPESLGLAAGDLHLWRIPLDVPDRQLRDLDNVLAPDERTRAGRFYFEKDRTRYTAARGALRVVLSGYLKKKPEDVGLIYGSHGKPMLPPGENRGGLQFNLSHSGDLALVAISGGRRIGIDLERTDPDVDIDLIAMRYFSVAEAAVLGSFCRSERKKAFFILWTCKEAFIKATGEGLAFPLHAVEMSGVLNRRNNFTPVPQEDPGDWHALPFSPEPGYAGALVIDGLPERAGFWNYAKHADAQQAAEDKRLPHPDREWRT